MDDCTLLFLALYAPAPENAPIDWYHHGEENYKAWKEFEGKSKKQGYYELPVQNDEDNAKWIEDGKIEFLNRNSWAEVEQRKALGYTGRTYLKLICSKCHKTTMVDDSIAYEYCPHCGVQIG